MKKILYLLLIFTSPYIFSQQLNIKETLNYIEKIENEYRKGWSESIVKYRINEEGYLIQDEYKLKEIEKLSNSISVHFDDIINNVSIDNWDDNEISIKCKNKNCFSFTMYRKEETKTEYKNDDDYFGKLDFVVRQEYQAKKMINAINYLFSLIQNEKFFRDEGDPFAKNITSNDSSSNKKSGKVSLKEKNGTFIINVNFNSLDIPFVLDSGAAEISISTKVEKQLLANGSITKNDYLSNGLYRVADGRIISQRRVLLKKVKVGKFTVRNVPASIGGEDSPLLLGKNFLDKFSNWSINNSDKTLELKI